MRAPPDGHTLLLVNAANAINATLYDQLSFNFIRDIAPVDGIMRVPSVMVVHPSLPAKSVPELIAYAKANPGKLSMASGGIGSGSHMAGELFNDDGRRQHGSRPLSWGGPGTHRPARRTGASHGRLLGCVD